MDLMTMGTDYVPDQLIEGYDSLIWTERYQATGEFQLITKNIDKTLALMPKGSLVAERNSQEVMIVEDHNIDESSDGAPTLTTTGRTFESFMENRATVVVNTTPGEEAMWTYKSDDIWPTDAAKALIMSHLTVSPEGPRQKVPNTAVENLIPQQVHKGQQMSYENEPGVLYDQVLNLLKMEGAGIRNQQDFQGLLKMYIYQGEDRTVNSDTHTPLIFSLDAGHIVNPKYLFTIKDYKNVAYVVGQYWQQRVYAPGVPTTVSGMDMRIVVVNGDEIKKASSDAKKTKQARALGLAELAKHNQTIFFDGEASPDSPYIRGRDYNLGDQVTLMAHYGVSQTMLISEYVRTDDDQGERGYPTLSNPSLVDDGS